MVYQTVYLLDLNSLFRFVLLGFILQPWYLQINIMYIKLAAEFKYNFA